MFCPTCWIMTVDLLLFISLISHCRKAQRAARKRIYQNITSAICWVLAEACMLVNCSHFYLICALCHISFRCCGRQCLVCYVFLCIFFVCTGMLWTVVLPQRKCSPTHPAVTVTLLIHPVRHVAGCTITLSQQDRNEHGHTQSIRDGTENLHLAASHCGPHIQDSTEFICIVLLSSSSLGLGWSASIITCLAGLDSEWGQNVVVYSSAAPLWVHSYWDCLCGPVVLCYLHSLFTFFRHTHKKVELFILNRKPLCLLITSLASHDFTCFCFNPPFFGTSLSYYNLK